METQGGRRDEETAIGCYGALDKAGQLSHIGVGNLTVLALIVSREMAVPASYSESLFARVSEISTYTFEILQDTLAIECHDYKGVRTTTE